MAIKHSVRSHARLSASSSARWMACPPSTKLNAEIPDVATDYAREGTCAHELAEFKVNRLLGVEAADPTENLDYFDQEMADCTDDYAQYIAEQISKYSNPVVMVEQHLDFSKYVPDGFGTGDCVIVADEVLTVIDYKDGKGVAVSAEHNSQMMLYALGALELFDSLYDISEIKMVIFQRQPAAKEPNTTSCWLSMISPRLQRWKIPKLRQFLKKLTLLHHGQVM